MNFTNPKYSKSRQSLHFYDEDLETYDEESDFKPSNEFDDMFKEVGLNVRQRIKLIGLITSSKMMQEVEVKKKIINKWKESHKKTQAHFINWLKQGSDNIPNRLDYMGIGITIIFIIILTILIMRFNQNIYFKFNLH